MPKNHSPFIVLAVFGICQFLPVAECASSRGLPQDRIDLVLEFQDQLNRSFRCDYSVIVGRTSRYASSSSAGIVLLDREFLELADSGSLFFAIVHEYAHAFLGHDLRLLNATGDPGEGWGEPWRMLELRRRFEKEADGIAARKARQFGYDLELFARFLLDQSDPEKGYPLESRIYSKPKDRVEYILAVYRSAQ